MKRVTAFVGSARKQGTYHAVRQFLDNLQSHGDVECEIVALSDCRLETCRGCKLCFDKGEEFCPLKDDRDALFAKIMSSDGVIFATPNYSFQVSGSMKVFLDRFGCAFHRPRFFGKTFTSIVVQGFYGGGKIVKYLDFVGAFLGFSTVKGTCTTSPELMTEKDRKNADRALAEQSRRFYARLQNPAYPVPTLFQLFVFRWGRTNIRLTLNDRSPDYRYFKAKGWFDSDYYYPIRLGALKRAAGRLVDVMATRMIRNAACTANSKKGEAPKPSRSVARESARKLEAKAR